MHEIIAVVRLLIWDNMAEKDVLASAAKSASYNMMYQVNLVLGINWLILLTAVWLMISNSELNS